MPKIVPAPNKSEIMRKSGLSEEQLAAFLGVVASAMVPEEKAIVLREHGVTREYRITRRGIGILTTPYGKFWQYDFAIDDAWGKYSAIVKADIDIVRLVPIFQHKQHLVLRTDSGCETGQLFHDLTCDCRDQLLLAMNTLAKVGVNEGGHSGILSTFVWIDSIEIFNRGTEYGKTYPKDGSVCFSKPEQVMKTSLVIHPRPGTNCKIPWDTASVL
jgi:hypothetical protein